MERHTEALAAILREVEARRDDPELLNKLMQLPTMQSIIVEHRAEYEQLSDKEKIKKAKALILEYEGHPGLKEGILYIKDEYLIRDENGKLKEIRIHLAGDVAEQIGFGSAHITYRIETENPSVIIKEFSRLGEIVHADLLEGPKTIQ